MLCKLLSVLIIGAGLALSSPIYSAAPGSTDFDPQITYEVIEQAGDWGCLVFENPDLDLMHYDCGGTDIWAPLKGDFKYYPQFNDYDRKHVTPEPKEVIPLCAIFFMLCLVWFFKNSRGQ